MYESSERRDFDDERRVRTTRSGISPALIGLAIVVVLAVVFVLQNREQAPIQFLFFERRTAVWIAIAIAIVIGVILDRLLSVWWRRHRHRAD